MERYLKDEPKMQKLPSDLDIFATPSVALASWKMEVDRFCLGGGEDAHEHDTLSTSSVSSEYSAISWGSAVSCSVVVKKEPLDDYDDLDLCCYDLVFPLENKRLKRGNNVQDNKHHLNQVKTEPRSSRLAAKLKKKQHNQVRNTSNGSQSDSSSSSRSSRSHQPRSKLGETTAFVHPKTETTLELMVRSSRNSSSSCSDSSDHLPILTPPSSPESMRTTSEAELALLGHQGLTRVSSANDNVPRDTKGSSRASKGARLLHATNQGLPMIAVAQRNATMPTSQASTSKDFELGLS